jgi:uncharacterized protein YbjT (DUF2867 family)/nitrite reductase/ring-hydroxylating ferredoxin subunit
MRIVVIGNTGLIGSRLVTTLRRNGHDAVAAPPQKCFDTLTGEGLTAVLGGADVVVDLADAPVGEDETLVQRFITATRTLLEFEVAAGVRHHVALTPVGTERRLESGYFRARLAQEQLIRHFPIPCSIVRASPLFESLETIADVATHGSAVRVPPVLVQPVAADDVVRLLAAIAGAAPLDGAIEIGGPEPFYLDALVERILGARNDPRTVIADAHAHYAGAQLNERALIAADEAELGEIRFDDWLRETAPPAANAAVPIEGAPGKEHAFRVSDVPLGSVLLMGDVAVFSVAGGLCATQAMCTHRAGPLSEGAVDDSTVTCPLHGAQFNIWTGAVLRGPAKAPLKTYRVILDGDVGRVVTDEATVVVERDITTIV